jgi:hypothetical protein
MIFETDLPIPNFPGLAGRQIFWARGAEFATAPCRQLFDWWTSRPDAALPRREDFDIVEHSDLVENIYIIAGTAEGFELRLAGEEYIRLFGLKRGWIWRSDAADPVMHDSAAFLAFVAQAKRPLRTIGRLELIERHWIELETVVCPLAPADDGRAKFLGCTAPIG